MKIPITSDGASWITIERSACPLSSSEFEEVWEQRPDVRPVGVMFGRRVSFPRRTLSFGRDYSFAGQVAQRVAPVSDMPQFARLSSLNATFNGALLNWYDAAENDYIGPHSDDERELMRCAPIVSITWSTNGYFRRFRMSQKNKSIDAAPFDIGDGQDIVNLYNGDIIVMGGNCQMTHRHEIMKPRKRCAEESNGRRINVTLRQFENFA